MVDYKEEWYLKRNIELTRTLLKIKKIHKEGCLKCVYLIRDKPCPDDCKPDKILKLIQDLNLESGVKQVTPNLPSASVVNSKVE